MAPKNIKDFKTVHQNSISKLQDFFVKVPESPSVKRNKFGLTTENSLFSQSAYQQLSQKQTGGSGARQLYVCVGCNTPLFTNKDIIDHSDNLTTASTTVRTLVNKN